MLQSTALKMASDTTTSPSRLLRLADSTDDAVSEAALMTLSKHPDRSVRMLVAKHARVTTAVLSGLSVDDHLFDSPAVRVSSSGQGVPLASTAKGGPEEITNLHPLLQAALDRHRQQGKYNSLHSADEATLHSLAADPHQDLDVLAYIEQNFGHQQDIRGTLQRNPATRLYRVKSGYYGESPAGVLKIPFLEEELFNTLFQSLDRIYWRQLAKHPLLPAQLQTKLFDTGNVQAIVGLLCNPRLSSEILNRIVASRPPTNYQDVIIDEDDIVHAQGLAWLATSSDSNVMCVAARHRRTDEATLTRLALEDECELEVATRPVVPDSVLIKLKRRFPRFVDMCDARLTSNVREMQEIAQKNSSLVICGLARNPRLPSWLAEELATADDFAVRQAVIENPNLPDALLQQLATRYGSASEVAHNPGVSEKALDAALHKVMTMTGTTVDTFLNPILAHPLLRPDTIRDVLLEKLADDDFGILPHAISRELDRLETPWTPVTGGSHHPEEEIGQLYVLFNPAMPGLVKVGSSGRSGELRARELSSSTGVPTPFILLHSVDVRNQIDAEQQLHRELEHEGLRYSDRREFFRLEPSEAIDRLLKFQQSWNQRH